MELGLQQQQADNVHHLTRARSLCSLLKFTGGLELFVTCINKLINVLLLE